MGPLYHSVQVYGYDEANIYRVCPFHSVGRVASSIEGENLVRIQVKERLEETLYYSFTRNLGCWKRTIFHFSIPTKTNTITHMKMLISNVHIHTSDVRTRRQWTRNACLRTVAAAFATAPRICISLSYGVLTRARTWYRNGTPNVV